MADGTEGRRPGTDGAERRPGRAVDEAAVPSSWRAYVRFEAVWRLCCFVVIIWIVGGLLIRTGEWPLVAIGTVVLVTSALAVVGLVVDLWKQHNNRSR